MRPCPIKPDELPSPVLCFEVPQSFNRHAASGSRALSGSSLRTRVHISTRGFLAIAAATAFLPAVLESLSQFFLIEASQRIAVQAACC